MPMGNFSWRQKKCRFLAAKYESRSLLFFQFGYNKKEAPSFVGYLFIGLINILDYALNKLVDWIP